MEVSKCLRHGAGGVAWAEPEWPPIGTFFSMVSKIVSVYQMF